MPVIRNLPTAWSDPVTLTDAEVWQARNGVIFVTQDAEPEDDAGLVLTNANVGRRLASGAVVRYRAADATPWAILIREPAGD